MARSYLVELKIKTHDETQKNKVLNALKTALKPLVIDGTIWTIDGNSQEVITPDAFTVE